MIQRRRFLAASAALSFTIVPRHVLGGAGQTAPSERVNLGGIGAGGQGGGDIGALAANGANVVALCDVDDRRAAAMYKKFPKARRYKDFRKMLDKEAKHLDAVSIRTPDHIHAPATMMALRNNLHVYCEKPLTHTIYEARKVAEEAKKHKVATQMGNQGHATEGARLSNEWIQAGVIGEVRDVHVWTDRAGIRWPQGILRPKGSQPVPKGLDWDLWLGPAPKRPYNDGYVPVVWRGWCDYGTGALGDMGCHIIDHPVWALKLGHPTSIESRVPLVGHIMPDKSINQDTFPLAAITYYDFPARGKLPPVKMTWYDGGLMPQKPAEMSEKEKLPVSGVLYNGSKGKMYHTAHGGMPVLLPHSLMEAAKAVPKTMKRSRGHHTEFIDACKGGPQPMSNFGYSGPMTEVVLLGNLGLRAPGKRLLWDGKNMKIKNAPELNQYVHKEYRKGWSL